ncbi:McrC family protein [Halosquirtibacter xylanolyticus]|uniref:McrC family protein n=1 Tax=Halosquirtibacter xylanolyticus TaxID=3374599 RepID=UPI003749AFDA|nr:McrC family protein [Prolixibacteraceae bacterium]
MIVFNTKEHHSFSQKEIEQIKGLKLDFSYSEDQVKFLGLNPNMNTSYFVGIDWLDVNEAAIQVNPKIENLDFLSMFMDCLNGPHLNKYLDKIYYIDVDNPQIETDSAPLDITPMLIVHFLGSVRNLARKGLKRDYIRVEENLQSKVKGKIKFSNHFKSNISNGRFDNNYCNYQEYSVDCLENQILKKTLLFTGSYINKCKLNYKTQTIYNFCMSAFDGVSDDIDAIMIKRIRINPVYKEYAEALKLAKLILKRFAYSISETNKHAKKKTPPFWIDMSLLFELYVLGKLKEAFGNQIQYQVSGKYGSVDFTKKDEKIVIDTKYKMIYNKSKYDIDNIRQISAYARDINIRKKLDAESDELLNCCIIYPNFDRQENFIDRPLLEEKIGQFEKFWKIGIQLPIH